MKIIILHGYNEATKTLGILAVHSERKEPPEILIKAEFKRYIKFTADTVNVIDKETLEKEYPSSNDLFNDAIISNIKQIKKLYKSKGIGKEEIDNIRYAGDVNLGFSSDPVFLRCILDGSISTLFPGKNVEVCAFSGTQAIVRRASLDHEDIWREASDVPSLKLYVKGNATPLYNSQELALTRSVQASSSSNYSPTLFRPADRGDTSGSSPEDNHLEDTESFNKI
ncbi:Uncharacterised protein [Legionella beliardensis]|uniref:Uncharacterized protein n=1 Tax=Legionella beliardensis TaxID=91822 RepID=A0A378I5J6_9GAMM|nr:hypothetical protein [Legionella beliardensis]STX29931.1 Uncharacterised protein [Legionella beliardensis]